MTEHELPEPLDLAPKPEPEKCLVCGQELSIVPNKEDWEWTFWVEPLGDHEWYNGIPRIFRIPKAPKPRSEWKFEPWKICVNCFFVKPNPIDETKTTRRLLAEAYRYIRDSEKAIEAKGKARHYGAAIPSLGTWTKQQADLVKKLGLKEIESMFDSTKCGVDGCLEEITVEKGKRLRPSFYFGKWLVICDEHKRILRNTKGRRHKAKIRRDQKTQFGVL